MDALIVLAALSAAIVLPLLALWAIARLHPLLSLAIGLALLALPFVGFMAIERQYGSMNTDGWGGLVKVVVYGGFAVLGLVSAAFGLVFAGDGAARLARREVVTGPRRRAAIVVVALAGATWLGYSAWRKSEAPPAAKREKAVLVREDAYGKLSAPIRDHYPLRWRARDGAPPLELSIPAGDFLRESAGEPRVEETRDGPEKVRLQLPAGVGGFHSLTLHRGDRYVEDRVLTWLEAGSAPSDPATPRALWIDRRDSGWSLRGLDCGTGTASRYPAIATGAGGVRCFVPEATLARYLPRAFGLERVRIHMDSTSANRCAVSFHFRGRVAQVAGPGRCLGEESLSTLREAVALLDRLARDPR